MKPGAAYEAIVDAIAAIAVEKTHNRDKFTIHRGPLTELPLRDRVFVLEFQTGVDRVETRMGCNEYHAEFSFTAVYTHSKNTQQRIGNDSRLVYDAVIGLIGSNSGEITDVTFLSSDISMGDERTYLARRNFDVTFIAST
jgi:hypothetical protein|tara:strand:- start:276 stop:695 length:420 start_codon:yes stop_codon:yes gene_type:complete